MMAKKRTQEDTREQIKQSLRDIHRGNRVLAVMAFGILILLAGLFFAAKQQQAPITFEERHAAIIEGYETPHDYMYNGFAFVYDGLVWRTLINRVDGSQFRIATHYDPRSVENMPVDPGLRNIIVSKQRMNMTMDDNMTSKTVQALVEIGRILGNRYDIYNMPISAGMTTPQDELPHVTCDNATLQQGVLYFHLGQENAVRKIGQCVHIIGTTEEDIIKSADRLLYILMGIMPERPPEAAYFHATKGFADWKNGPAVDGLKVNIQPKDFADNPVSIEGEFVVKVIKGNETLYTWEDNLLLSYYNRTGNAPLHLSAPQEEMAAWSNVSYGITLTPRGKKNPIPLR